MSKKGSNPLPPKNAVKPPPPPCPPPIRTFYNEQETEASKQATKDWRIYIKGY